MIPTKNRLYNEVTIYNVYYTLQYSVVTILPKRNRLLNYMGVAKLRGRGYGTRSTRNLVTCD